MIAETRGYQQALTLIEALKKSGIEANITTYAVSIWPDDEQQKKRAAEICDELKIHHHDGSRSDTHDFVEAFRLETKAQ